MYFFLAPKIEKKEWEFSRKHPVHFHILIGYIYLSAMLYVLAKMSTSGYIKNVPLRSIMSVISKGIVLKVAALTL